MGIMEPSDENIAKYNLQILPQVQDIEPTYSIVTRPRSHNIKGGDNIEIDIYLAGVGIPDVNKFVLLWSSPNIIDVSTQGNFTYCIKEFNKTIDGRQMAFPIAGKNLVEHQKLDPTGVVVHLNKGYFLPVPTSGQGDLPVVMGEVMPEGYPPISISLKTLRKAKPGDYAIDVAFTYIHRNTVRQACDKVEFRLTSRWDRNQWWILTAGSIIALLLLVLTIIANLCWD